MPSSSVMDDIWRQTAGPAQCAAGAPVTSHIGLDELVSMELHAFTDCERFTVHGPSVSLRPRAATTLGNIDPAMELLDQEA